MSKNLMQVVQFLHNLHQQLAWSQIMTGFLKAKFLTNYFYLISEGTKSTPLPPYITICVLF